MKILLIILLGLFPFCVSAQGFGLGLTKEQIRLQVNRPLDVLETEDGLFVKYTNRESVEFHFFDETCDLVVLITAKPLFKSTVGKRWSFVYNKRAYNLIHTDTREYMIDYGIEGQDISGIHGTLYQHIFNKQRK